MVARGTLRSGSRTTPATMAPVSRPTNAQNTGDSDSSTTAASDLPVMFQAERYRSKSKCPQPAVMIAATGSRPSTTHSDWKRAIGRGPIRLIANINQISTTWPSRRTPWSSPKGSRITRYPNAATAMALLPAQDASQYKVVARKPMSRPSAGRM